MTGIAAGQRVGCGQAGQRHPAVVAVVGPAACGKTTLICRLLPLLQARGLRLGVIKHSHKILEVDQPGKDTWRFRQSGAQAVALVAPAVLQLTLADRLEPPLETVLGVLPPDLDLILVEGYKSSSLPKLAFLPTTAMSTPDYAPPVLAYLASGPGTASQPVFFRDQVEEIAAFLLQWLQKI